MAKQTAAVQETITDDARRRMIAEAAYYRAQARGFCGGDPVADWLAAEADIQAALGEAPPVIEEDEIAAYHKLREEFFRTLAGVRDTVNADTVRHALDFASHELRELGAHTSQTVTKVGHALKKDIASAVERTGPAWHTLPERVTDLFAVWRHRGNAFLAEAATAVDDWLEHTHVRQTPHTYRAGEMTAGGAFECTACGARLEVERPGHLPACPDCQGDELRRV